MSANPSRVEAAGLIIHETPVASWSPCSHCPVIGIKLGDLETIHRFSAQI